MRHVFLALVLVTSTTFAAAGCSDASTPAPTASEPEKAISTTSSSSPTPTATAGTSSADDWEALNSYDGITTNSFLRLPRAIGDMEQKQQDSSPPDLEVHTDYVSTIRDAKARVAIYYARTASGPIPVRSATDPDFTEIVAGNAHAFQEAGTSRAVDAGGVDWSCFEGSRGGLAHTICVTPKYGRVVEVQYINAGRVDRTSLDAFLGGVGDSVTALSK